MIRSSQSSSGWFSFRSRSESMGLATGIRRADRLDSAVQRRPRLDDLATCGPMAEGAGAIHALTKSRIELFQHGLGQFGQRKRVTLDPARHTRRELSRAPAIQSCSSARSVFVSGVALFLTARSTRHSSALPVLSRPRGAPALGTRSWRTHSATVIVALVPHETGSPESRSQSYSVFTAWVKSLQYDTAGSRVR